MDTRQSSTRQQPQRTAVRRMSEKHLRRISRLIFYVFLILCIGIVAGIIVVEVLYGTHVPGYTMHVPLVIGDSVRIVYKHEAGYVGSQVTQTIFILAPNYELLPVKFNIYRGDCETLNDHTKTERVTTNVTLEVCSRRCLVNEYIYFVTKKGSWLTYHILDYHMYNNTVEGSVPDDVVLRFVLFDDRFEFSSFLNGSNDTIPLQQVVVDGKDEVVRFDLSEMKKPASYYFVGIEIIGTYEFFTVDMHADINQVIYYVWNLVKDCFACITNILSDEQYTKQCFIVQAIPRYNFVSAVPSASVINVTAIVSPADKTDIHGLTLALGIPFLLFHVLMCISSFVIGFTKVKLMNNRPHRAPTIPSRRTQSSNRNTTPSEEDPNMPLIPSRTRRSHRSSVHHDQVSESCFTNTATDRSSGINNHQVNDSFFINVIAFLKSKPAIDCFTLGHHLGISMEKLYEIERKFEYDKTVYIHRILYHWRTCQDEWSVQAIADALKASGYHILSAIVIYRFGGNDTSTQATTRIKDDTLLDQLFDKNPDIFLQEPSVEDLCSTVMPKILTKWELFGTLLGIEQYEIEVIKIENLGVCRNCFLELLYEWKRSQSKPYTWSTVIKVLHSPSFNEHLLDEEVYMFCLLR